MSRLTGVVALAALLCSGGLRADPEDDQQSPPATDGAAKDNSDGAPRPYLHDLFGQPSWLDVGVEYRLRYETLDNRYRPGETGGDQQLDHRTHLRLGIQRVLDPLRFVVEFEDSRAQLTDSGSTVNETHTRELGVLQLHAKLVTESLFGRGLHSELQFGRVTMDLGKRRLVARNVFRNTINRFDGLRWSVAAPNKWDLQAFLVQPVNYAAPDFNRGRREGYFWGLYYQNRTLRWLKYDLYYLHLYENKLTVQGRLRRLKTIGTRLYRTPVDAGWRYEFETALQFGQNKGQRQLDHLQNVEAGYTWASAWKPTLLFQYTYASGDANPSDNRSGRFDTLFGARRFELAPTGIYALFSRSNLSSPGYRVLLKPVPGVDLMFIHRLFRLAQSKDEWRGMSRRDVTGRSGSRLGNHLEGVFHYRLNANLGLEFGYAHFLPGAFVERQVPGNGMRGLNYFYVMHELRL